MHGLCLQKVHHLMFLCAGSVSSPRLASTSLSTLITVVDDEGGSGVFQFGASSITTTEQGGSPSTVDVYVTRSGGFAGRVSVVVTSVNGRIGVASGMPFGEYNS